MIREDAWGLMIARRRRRRKKGREGGMRDEMQNKIPKVSGKYEEI